VAWWLIAQYKELFHEVVLCIGNSGMRKALVLACGFDGEEPLVFFIVW